MARADTLIQALVPSGLASWVRSRAALEGLQVSGWIRQLIVRERMLLVVDAWWCPPQPSRKPARSDRRAFRLERLASRVDGTVEFRLLDHDHGCVRDDQLASAHGAMRDALYDGTFVLRGDPRRWSVVQAFADADAGNAMRLVMMHERTTRRKDGT